MDSETRSTIEDLPLSQRHHRSSSTNDDENDDDVMVEETSAPKKARIHSRSEKVQPKRSAAPAPTTSSAFVDKTVSIAQASMRALHDMTEAPTTTETTTRAPHPLSKKTHLSHSQQQILARVYPGAFDESVIRLKIASDSMSSVSEIYGVTSLEEMCIAACAHVLFSNEVRPDLKPLVSGALRRVANWGCLAGYLSIPGLRSELIRRYAFSPTETENQLEVVINAQKRLLDPLPTKRARAGIGAHVNKSETTDASTPATPAATTAASAATSAATLASPATSAATLASPATSAATLASPASPTTFAASAATAATATVEKHETDAQDRQRGDVRSMNVRVFVMSIRLEDGHARGMQTVLNYRLIPNELKHATTMIEYVTPMVNTSSLTCIDSMALLAVMGFINCSPAICTSHLRFDTNVVLNIDSPLLKDICGRSRFKNAVENNSSLSASSTPPMIPRADMFVGCMGRIRLPMYMYQQGKAVCKIMEPVIGLRR